MLILNLFTDLFISTLYFFVFNYFLNNKYASKNSYKIIKYIIQFILIFLICNDFYLIYRHLYHLILLIFLIITMSFFYKIQKKEMLCDIIYTVFCLLICIVINVFLYEFIFETTYINSVLYSFKFPKLFLNIMIAYLLYISTSVYLKYTKPNFLFNIRIFKLISLFISILYVCFVLFNVKEVFYSARVAKIMIFTFIIYNAALIFFDRYQTKHEKIERDLWLRKQQAEDERKYIQDKMKSDDEISKLRHDLKNTFLILQGYLATDEYEKAKMFIDEHVGRVFEASAIIHTGISAIDSVLEGKIQTMKEKDIAYHENISHLSFGEINDHDIAMILGLAFDNAIEAAEKAEVKEIQLTLTNHINFLLIELTNTIAPGSKLDFTRTSKIYETYHHGYGVKGMKEYARVYDGDVHYDTGYDKVILRIHLNMKKAGS